MLAKVEKRNVIVQQHLCFGGEHNLPPMPGGGDAGGLVHIEPYVVILADVRLACVQTHAHPDRPRPQSFLSLDCSRNRLCCGPKNDEEGIAPCANFDAAVTDEHFAKNTAVLREGSNVSLTQLAQEERRSLYIGKEEGDGP